MKKCTKKHKDYWDSIISRPVLMQAKILQDMSYNMVSLTSLCCADVFARQLIQPHNVKP